MLQDTEKKFFVRISGEAEVLKAHVESVFGPVEIVKAEGVSGEFGFVTGTITEGQFETFAKEFPGILHSIRVDA